MIELMCFQQRKVFVDSGAEWLHYNLGKAEFNDMVRYTFAEFAYISKGPGEMGCEV